MENFGAAVFGAAYELFGVDATLVTPAGAFVLRVQDKSYGVAVTDSSNVEVKTIRPAACVRVSDLNALGLTRDSIRKGALTMNARNWRIENALPRPTPNGEDDGELMLILIKG